MLSTDNMNAEQPSEFFAQDHHRCDELWAAFEGASASEAAGAWQEFEAAMRRHFSMEEEVLFPALEDATGMHGPGPTMVMRNEHVQMRGLLDEMGNAVREGRIDDALDHGDTLLMMTQQHNVKEEGVLYPLADQAMGHQWQALAARLAEYGA
jgi:hemerythrin-like domain-containing protein